MPFFWKIIHWAFSARALRDIYHQTVKSSKRLHLTCTEFHTPVYIVHSCTFIQSIVKCSGWWLANYTVNALVHRQQLVKIWFSKHWRSHGWCQEAGESNLKNAAWHQTHHSDQEIRNDKSYLKILILHWVWRGIFTFHFNSWVSMKWRGETNHWCWLILN